MATWHHNGHTVEFRQHVEPLASRNEREPWPAGYVYASTGWFIDGEPVTEEVAKAQFDQWCQNSDAPLPVAVETTPMELDSDLVDGFLYGHCLCGATLAITDERNTETCDVCGRKWKMEPLIARRVS
jgi:hypothetical protein